MMTLTTHGKLLQARLDKQVGDPYQWGKEDCSELFFDVMGPEGFGVVRQRLTANAYYRMGTRIDHPSQVGDYFVELRPNGTAHHIGMYYGPDAHGVEWTVEARGKEYGTPKYRMTDPRNGVHARGGIWMRLKGVHLGGFTVAAPHKPKPVPPAKPAPKPKPVPAAKVRVTASSLRLRAKPSLRAKIIATLAHDTIVAVVAGSTPLWVHVSYAGHSGYVWRGYTRKVVS